MHFYGTLESLITYSSGQWLSEPARQEDAEENVLEDLLRGKLRCLESIIADIRHDIGARARLSTKLAAEITRQYCYLKTKLYELDSWTLGRNRSIEGRRLKLELQLDELNHQQREELVSAWQDIASLKKELRTWGKQYSDLAQRVRLVLDPSVR